MCVRKLLGLAALAALSMASASAQYCNSIEPREASAILGGTAVPLNLGIHGCSFSVKGRPERLSVMLLDAGANARKTFDDMKKQTRTGGWFVAEESGLGYLGFSQMVRASAKVPSAKCEFVFLKGNQIIEVYVSGTTGKAVLDKLRPVAQKVAAHI